MSDWTREYVPDAASVVGGRTQAQTLEVETLASRIADAVAVRRIGTSLDVLESVSNVKSYGAGPVIGYMANATYSRHDINRPSGVVRSDLTHLKY